MKKEKSKIKCAQQGDGEKKSRDLEREKGEREERQRRKSHAATEKSGRSLHSPECMWVQCYTKIFLLLFY